MQPEQAQVFVVARTDVWQSIMRTGFAALKQAMGMEVARSELPAAQQRLWDFDEAAHELLALISEESGLVARTRAQQILLGLRSIVQQREKEGRND